MEKKKIWFDGEGISLNEPEKVFAELTEHPHDKREMFKALYGFVVECSNARDVVSAYANTEKMLLYADTAGERPIAFSAWGNSRKGPGISGER